MSRTLYLILGLILLTSLTASINLFQLITLPKTNGAMCMDGTQTGLYLYQSELDPPPNKLLIYFEDVWEYWCAKETLNESISRCYKYVNDTNLIDYGSSNNWAGSFMVLSGILAPNGPFSSWNKVIVKTCDGGSYFSDSNATFKEKTLNFRGSNNVKQTINYLKKNNQLTLRDEVVIVGVGNGGLAALAWADYIKNNTRANIKLIIDAGVWEDQLNQKTKTAVFKDRVKNLDKLFLNGKSFPNPKCEQANKGSIEKCFYATQLIKYVDPAIKVMFLQSYYDDWEAMEILGIDCTQDFGSLSECTAEHRQAVQDYHKKITASLQVLAKVPNVMGVFGIACVAHYFTGGKIDYTDFSVPMNSNNTAGLVINKWITGKNITDKLLYMDSVQWPNNKACSHQVKQFNQLKSQ